MGGQPLHGCLALLLCDNLSLKYKPQSKEIALPFGELVLIMEQKYVLFPGWSVDMGVEFVCSVRLVVWMGRQNHTISS